MTPTRGEGRLRWAAAAALFGGVAVPSYAIQRLLDAIYEAPVGTVLQQASIPYYWRVGLSVLHGLSAALMGGLLLRDEAAAERFLARLPWFLWPTVLLSVLAMALRP